MISHWISAIALRAPAIVGPSFPVEIVSAALLTTLVFVFNRWCPVASSRLVGKFESSAKHANLYILAAMLLPVAFRLALLPWLSAPHPYVHDEFVHLLVADTLAAGRLANPPHPLWRHLETLYVLQQPTYSAIYPIGQGAILALGKTLTGNAWAGVLLASALLSGAITWMLFGSVAPVWAAGGGLLASFHFANKWMDSYWGGAFWGFGGALLFGALCRLRKAPSTGMGAIAGLGWSIIWLTRPFESLPCLIFAAGVIAALVIGDSSSRRQWVLPIAAMLLLPACAGLITLLHNRAVTGSFATLPYQLSQQAYGVPQSLLWQPPIKPPTFRFKEAKDMYWWQRTYKDAHQRQLIRRYVGILFTAWVFYVTPWYSVPILLALVVLRDRDVFLAGTLILTTLASGVLYPFFIAHYIAAYSCLIVFLIIRGFMVLVHWSFRGKAAGHMLAVFLIAGGFAMAVIPPRLISSSGHPIVTRDKLADKLMALGGRHVVFIRYGANHKFNDEWVYNSADVDSSPMVWCRAMGPDSDSEVTRYYKDRQAWIATVDGELVRVAKYQPGLPEGPASWLRGGKP